MYSCILRPLFPVVFGQLTIITETIKITLYNDWSFEFLKKISQTIEKLKPSLYTRDIFMIYNCPMNFPFFSPKKKTNSNRIKEGRKITFARMKTRDRRIATVYESALAGEPTSTRGDSLPRATVLLTSRVANVLCSFKLLSQILGEEWKRT